MIMPIKIFFCYAHEDSLWRDEFEKHLSVLKHSGEITTWYDQKIQPGTDWNKEIDEQLNSADIILLLISADFMASYFCFSVEMQMALQRHNSRDARIIPIILRSVVWETTPIGQLQPLPTDAKPITLCADRDEALKDVVIGIERVVRMLVIEKYLKEQIDKGNAHYYAGCYQEALECYYNVIDASGERPGRNFRSLAFDYRKNNYELPDFNKLKSFGYRDVDLLTKIGSGLWHTHDYYGALIAFEQALDIEPDNALAWISKGIVLEGLRRSEEAQLCFKKAQELTLRPTFRRRVDGKKEFQ